MTYSMEFHYLHVHELLCAETLRVRGFRHRFVAGQFVPVVSPSALKSPDEMRAAAACLRNVVGVVCGQWSGSEFEFCSSLDRQKLRSRQQ